MTKTKKWFSCAGILALMLIALTPVWAQDIQVTLNGAPLSFGAVPPANVGGRVLVPLRGVFEALGAQVDYQASTRTVLASRGATSLKLQIGSTTAYVDNSPVKLDVPAQVVLGRTLVPLRFVSEAMGAQVAWNASTRTVAINSETGTSSGQTQTVTGSVVKLDTVAPATITVKSTSGTRTYQIVSGATIQRQPELNDGTTGKTSSIALGQITVGENVKLTVNDNNQVVRIVAQPLMIPVAVRSINGKVLTLDDDANTRITIGNDVAYINKQGNRTSNVDARAGDQVALFIAQDTRLIYQVSAASADVNLANGGSDLPYNPPSSGDVPRIELVQHDAVNAVKAGDVIKVTVRGTAGLKGTFDISQDITGKPLRENQAGVYTGSYKVRAGDDVYQGYVTARLSSDNGYTVTQQSQEPFTIDTKAPLVVGTLPRNGATVDVAQPNIIIYTDDQGGSGLAPTTITLINDGKTYQVDATVAPPQSIRAVVPNTLDGAVEVKAAVKDNAGNVTDIDFTFTAEANAGPIKSINHNAARALSTGDALTVDMTAPTGGRASFDLVREDDPDDVVVQGIPMVEIEARHYRGAYNVLGTRDEGTLIVVGRFRDKDGALTVKNATTPVDIVSQRGTDAPVINTPKDGAKVTSPLTIRGKASPRNTVQVNVRATGTQYYILPYEQDLGTFNVTANAKGAWHTDPIEIPNPKGVSGLKLIITAVQEDATGQTSTETTITVQPQ